MVAVPIQVVGRRLTFEDYQALPDDQRYEIIKGTLYAAPRPRSNHQIIASRVAYEIGRNAEQYGIGTVMWSCDLVVAEKDVYVAPDIMFFVGDRFASVDLNDWIRIVPDLIVEVGSPFTDVYHELTKSRIYAEIGVAHYWRVDVSRRVMVEGVLGRDSKYQEHTFQVGEVFKPTLLPDLRVDAASIFV